MRRVLELDRPLPVYTEAERAAFIERNFRWNATANLMDGLLYWLGLTLVSGSTIAPLFISKLTTSPVPIGLVAVLTQAGWYLPQLFTANWTERLPRRKPVAVNLGLMLERLPLWLLVVAVAVAGRQPGLSLGLFLIGYAMRALGGGATGPAWQDLIARVIPVDRRGRFWGLTSSLGVGLGVAGSLLSAWLLRSLPFPRSFLCIFALAAACLSLGWLFVAQTREPPQPVTAPRISQRQFLAGIPALIRRDAPFGRFLAARALLALAGMGIGFVTVAALRRWAVADATVGLYTAVLLVGQASGNLLFGLIGDRRGHKVSLEWAALAYAAAFALAWLAPGPAWYYAVFCLLGLAAGSVTVSGLMVVLEFSGTERRPTYVGLANTATGAASLAGPLLATGLAAVNVDWALIPSAVLSLAAWAAMRWYVAEPRRA